MLSRALSAVTSLWVTVGYAAMLVVSTLALSMLGPRAEDVVDATMSTNLHNLAHGHLETLIGSAFVTTGGPIYGWLPGLVCLLALVELFWRGGRLILAFGLGHVGATLIVAGGLAAAVRFGWLPISVVYASDVGTSYGVAAVLGALTAAIPAYWRPAWIGAWLALAVLAIGSGGDFSSVGHFVALILGMLVSTRFHSDVRWTHLRLVLLVIGAAFGYGVLANTDLARMAAPIAGLLGALTGHWVARGWRHFRLDPSGSVTAFPRLQERVGGNDRRRYRGRKPGVEGDVCDQGGYFLGGHAVGEGSAQMGGQFVGPVQRDQRGQCRDAAVAGAEPGVGPHVAVER
jgi:hypothetical protein